jgi:triphosphoribosyl-dephospho-CoA synthetase
MARQALNGKRSVASLDSYLRSKGNKLNPGTTCDLTATALFLKALG